MSSFPLTNSIIFQTGRAPPPTRLRCYNSDAHPSCASRWGTDLKEKSLRSALGLSLLEDLMALALVNGDGGGQMLLNQMVDTPLRLVLQYYLDVIGGYHMYVYIYIIQKKHNTIYYTIARIIVTIIMIKIIMTMVQTTNKSNRNDNRSNQLSFFQHRYLKNESPGSNLCGHLASHGYLDEKSLPHTQTTLWYRLV